MPDLISRKKYCDGVISKNCDPKDTVERVLNNFKRLGTPILNHYSYTPHPSGIPLYVVFGTYQYYQVTNTVSSFGKGHTKTQALASGLMEMAERFSAFSYINNGENFKIATLDQLLMEGNDYTLDYINSNIPEQDNIRLFTDQNAIKRIPIRWYPAVTEESQLIWIPLGYNTFTDVITTTGFAAGNTFAEAKIHAICEFVERHLRYKVLRENFVGRRVSIASIDSEINQLLIKSINALGSTIEVRDYSSCFQFPAFGVMRRKSNKILFSLGVATDRNEALSRALTENVQTERDKNTVFEHDSFDYIYDFTEEISFEKCPEIFDLDYSKEESVISDILQKMNLNLFTIDATHPKLQVPTCLVYIPKLNLWGKAQHTSSDIIKIRREVHVTNIFHNLKLFYSEIKADKNASKSTEALLVEADISQVNKDYVEVINLVNETLKINTSHDPVIENISYQILLYAYLNLHDYENCVLLCQNILKANQQDNHIHLPPLFNDWFDFFESNKLTISCSILMELVKYYHYMKPSDGEDSLIIQSYKKWVSNTLIISDHIHSFRQNFNAARYDNALAILDNLIELEKSFFIFASDHYYSLLSKFRIEKNIKAVSSILEKMEYMGSLKYFIGSSFSSKNPQKGYLLQEC